MANDAVKEWGGWDSYLEQEEENARQELARKKAEVPQSSPVVQGTMTMARERQLFLFQEEDGPAPFPLRTTRPR